MVAVKLLIFMCVNKLLADTGDPPGMIYPAGYGSGENSPPMAGMGILAVPNFYGRDGSEVAIPDGDLPIAILSAAAVSKRCRAAKLPLKAVRARSRTRRRQPGPLRAMAISACICLGVLEMFGSVAMPVKMRPDAGTIYSSISTWSGEKEQWSSLVVHLCLASELI